jgi:hypothetical protein
MKTTSIHIEGNIISPEIFDRLESNDLPGQFPQNYGFDKGKRVKDEIALAWADAKDQWNIFKRRIEKLDDKESGTTETRKYWIIPLLETLGYSLAISNAEIVNGNSFAISHRAQNLDGFPVHIVGVNDSLDKKRETGGPRLSPHALVQEYLNITEHLYAIVTNGHQLRILRDSGKLIRLTYMEFDLFQMMEDDLYAEFSIMYRLIHASRMPQKLGEGDSSIIEQYHQLSLEAGARIRDGLSKAVEKSIYSVANGFLKHSANEELRTKLRSGEIKNEQYYQYMLRFIYRVLFLMVLEERNIVYPQKNSVIPEADCHPRESDCHPRPQLIGDPLHSPEYLRDIYYNYYSITRIRKLSENIFFFDEKLDDLWISLRNTFKIYGSERLAAKLGIYPLNGELFGSDSLGILSESDLDNHTLLECIRNLSLFENPETRSIIHVNYAALNVEEFGSVYEGLLEKSPVVSDNGGELSFTFIKGSERSSSGSHYMPEELVQPLIKHSLDYIIEDKLANCHPRPQLIGDPLKAAKESALLSIKVCDVACGSGHILLSAARRIAIELARVRTGEDQPSPEPYRHAMRDVINHCIYGVDKNPLAVELCKVALWLEAYNPGMPLSFLDHRIKCGDSIVGLARIEELQNGIATEAFKTMPGDEKDITASFRKQNKDQVQKRSQINISDTAEITDNLKHLSVKFKLFDQLPDSTVDEVSKKQKEYDVLKGTDWMKLKELADIQVAQFFLPKINKIKEFLTTDTEYFRIYAGQKNQVNTRKVDYAMGIAAEKNFFHWFLEFPEVMQEGGFDCILGNPPFLGGKRISTHYGDQFLNFLQIFYSPHGGITDLVVYFVRRIYDLLNGKGFLGLLSTNTITQGDSRIGGLGYIVENGGQINFAIKSMRWPGEAAVFISIFCINKNRGRVNKYLNNSEVGFINSSLGDDIELTPHKLNRNSNTAFIGNYVLGQGFVLSIDDGTNIIKKDLIYKDVIFSYLNGENLNTNPEQKASRKIINFFDWEIEKAQKYELCFDIVEKKVKPERQLKKEIKLAKLWWQYARKATDLHKQINDFKRVLVIAQVSKTGALCFVENNQVFDAKLIVFAIQDYSKYSVLQSVFHIEWAWRYGTTMKTDLSYGPTNIYETFPFPHNSTINIEEELKIIGEGYHGFRQKNMSDMQLGLTKIYNLFHDQDCNLKNISRAKNIREFKQANLQISLEEAIVRIEQLRELHKQMDEAVLKAYDWTDINLAHDFYEVDYLPENDRIRYTISPEARKEILKRLLSLNHQIHEEEEKSGHWRKDKTKKKTNSLIVNEQGGLFGE